MNTKICTSLEQSKRLAEILPTESADMYYPHLGEGQYGETPRVGNISEMYSGKPDIPCWSLSTLLDILPKQIGRYTKSLYWFDEGWHCEYLDEDSEGKYGVSADNPIDACYEMIIKLKGQNIL